MVYGYGNKVVKSLMFFTNFAIFFLGVLVFTFSLWANLDRDFSAHLRDFAEQAKIDEHFVNELAQYEASLWILVAVGALLLVVGFLGCCGTACESNVLLTLYFVVILILALVEFLTVLAMFTNRAELFESVHNAFIESSKTADGRRNLKPIQTALNCCGATVESQHFYLAEGLCTGSLHNADDCYTVLAAKLNSDAVLVSAVLLLLAQFFSMFFSCVLCKAFRERACSSDQNLIATNLLMFQSAATKSAFFPFFSYSISPPFCPFTFVFVVFLLLPINNNAFTDNTNLLVDNEFSADVISQAFVQTGSELHYFRDISHQQDGGPTFLASSTSANKVNDGLEAENNAGKKKLFEAESTDFGKSVLGVPVQRRVFLSNPGDKNLIISAITSSSISFHCSFVEQKSLAPQQQTFFRVFFLPVLEHFGLQQEVIKVHTSVGTFSHRVQGESVGNPYRIRSFLGIRLPLNATFSAPFSLHNPHSKTMILSELFVSDCNVRIELNDGTLVSKKQRTEDDKKEPIHWRFRPFETREIGKTKVLGNVERNSTSFIVAKMRNMGHQSSNAQSIPIAMHEKSELKEEPLDQLLIFAVGVQVSRRRDLFPTVDLLDFGLVQAGGQIRPLTFSVYSSLERGVEIESVYVGKQTRGVYLQFESRPPISIKGGAKGQPGLPITVASVNIDTRQPNLAELRDAEDDGTTKDSTEQQLEQRGREGSDENSEMVTVRRGTVVAETRGGNYKVSIPFRAVIYRGQLEHDMEATAFHQGLDPIVHREVTITNSLPFGLAIWGIKLAKNAKDAFQASLVSDPAVVLFPGQSLPTFLLTYLRKQSINFSSKIILNTNVTTYKFPIVVFGGDLQIRLHAHKQSEFDFGSVGWDERRTILFSLSNSNPVSLRLKRLHAPFPALLSLSFIGVHRLEHDNQAVSVGRLVERASPANVSSSSSNGDRWAEGLDFALPAHSLALFNLTLSAPSQHRKTLPSSGVNTFQLQTQFATHEFPVKFELVDYHLESVPSEIVFRDAFIGTVQTHPIKFFNTFADDLHIHHISITDDDDPRFQLYHQPNVSVTMRRTIPSKSLVTVANVAFVPGSTCPQHCYLGIQLDTSEGQWFAYGMKLPQNLAEIDHYLYMRLRKEWLSMGDKRVVKTQLRMDTDRVKGVEVPIEGHLVWPRLLSHSVVHFPLTAVGNFTIVNLTLSNPTTNSVIVQLLPLVIYPDAEFFLDLFRAELPVPLADPVEINETLMFSLRDTELFTLRPGSPVPQFTQTLLLRPGMSTRIRIGFLPNDYALHSSLLLIRNNLTALEPVVLYGRGAKMHMDIDNKTARSQPLLFEILPQHLADCANPRRQLHKLPTTLTVRRSFVVRNSGEVSFSVFNISISNTPCENRGFRVLNCDRFRLEPNETILLDIAYTPDFLLSTNEATLQLYMHMNGTPWSFDLVSTIPPHLLSVCHAALPRPPFESMMYYTCVLALTFCFICVVSCAYLEGDRVISCAYRQQFAVHCHDEKTAVDLDASVPDEQNSVSSSTGTTEDEVPSRKTQFLQAAQDAGPLNKLFWRTLNCILWVFSYVWPLVRGSNKQSIATTNTGNNWLVDGTEDGKAEEMDDELLTRLPVSDEIAQHPKDPEQIHSNFPLPPLLSNANGLDSANIVCDDELLDFTDPYLFMKFRSFLNAEKLSLGAECTGGQRHKHSVSSSTTTSETQQQPSNGTRERIARKKKAGKKRNKPDEANKFDLHSIGIKKNLLGKEPEHQRNAQGLKSAELSSSTTGSDDGENLLMALNEKSDEKGETTKKTQRTTTAKRTGKANNVYFINEKRAEVKRHGKSPSAGSSHVSSSSPRTASNSADKMPMTTNKHSKARRTVEEEDQMVVPSSSISYADRRRIMDGEKERPEWFNRLFTTGIAAEDEDEKVGGNNHDEQQQQQQQPNLYFQHEQRPPPVYRDDFGTEFVWKQLHSTKFRFEDNEEVEEKDELAQFDAPENADAEMGAGVDMDSSDSSAAPEWADQAMADFTTVNVDDDFFDLANQSAEFFDQISNDGCSTSLQQSDRNLPTDTDTFTPSNRYFGVIGSKIEKKENTDAIVRDKMLEAEDLKTQRIIDTLTQEYREKLTKVLNSARNPMLDIHQLLDDLNLSPSACKLTLPPDLSSGCGLNETKPTGTVADNHLNTTNVGRNVGTATSSSSSRLGGTTELQGVQQRKRKSPGREHSERLRNAVDEPKKEKTDGALSPLPNFDILFNIEDPIWKPIGAIDERLSWPAQFMKKEKKTTKKQKDDK
uniref:Tetraspanin n=1 Tax=Globodera rostochiensis TaxID=31243 RepID=A0A914HW42_GLORO